MAILYTQSVVRATMCYWIFVPEPNIRQHRFPDGGIAALGKAAPRPTWTRTIDDCQVKRMVRRTVCDKPANATHWSTRSLATTTGISQASVRRIW